MCGIVGIYSYRNREKTWPAGCLDRMLTGISHRGPDGVGRHLEPGLFMGHARLAVIDLSSAGRQPMFSSDKRLLVSFNGEIYNFGELRDELKNCGYSFVSGTDTEVLLAAWREWGESSLDRLNGIFAFAMYDFQEKSLFLVRDQLGIKPLFYHSNGDEVFFASELLPLFSANNPCPAEKPEDVDSYFTFNYLPAPRTGLKDVNQLQPGSLLRIDRNGLMLKQFWSPEFKGELLPWNNATVDSFRQTLFSSVKSQTVSDVPLGLFLSGGLDSYSVALAAVSNTIPISAFTLGFDEPGFDETSDAAEYARRLNVTNDAVKFYWDDSIIERTLSSMGELLADASCFPYYQLSAFAKQKVSVVLAGDGGDELMAGYDTYLAGELTPLIRLIPPFMRSYIKRVASTLPYDTERYGKRMVIERLINSAEAGPHRDHASFRRIFSDEVKKRLYQPDFLDAVKSNDPIGEYSSLIDNAPPEWSSLAARQYADLLFHLPSVLAKVDRMSMAHGLEVRVPLLSKEMVAFNLNLDDAAKRSLSCGKRILRKALAGYIPDSALRRSKAGFLPPVDSWFRMPGPMATVFGDYLLTARKSIDTLKWDQVEQYWQEHRDGKIDGGFVLLGILQYINWHTKCRTN